MQKRRLAALAVALGSTALLWHCGGSSPASPTPPGGGGPTPIPPVASSAVILAAGDIGECGFGAHETGAMLDRLGGTILALGDLAYMQGTAANFRDCYDSAWGRHLDRTRPTPGNHEYETAGASAYFDYFGDLAGPRGQGYYAFSAGPWRIIALNSEVPGGPGSAQGLWLRTELETNRTACTLAYFHRPLFTSGPNGTPPDSTPRDLWRTLAEFGADVVLNGHEHMYERFAPQDIDGRPSPGGIREFIAGTGGAHLYTPGAAKPNSESRAKVYGILTMTLTTNAYQWDFVSNTAFHDAGSGTCH
jgi:acid phosphatase type 7